jgi:integrase
MNVKRSWRTDECRLGVLTPFFKDVYLDEVTPLMIQKCLAWRLKRGNTKSTANRYLALLKKIFSIAVEEGYLDKSPASRIKKFPGADRPKERILSNDEEARLMAVSSPGLRSVLVVALNTGMRYGEILNLTWGQIDFNSMQLTVEKTKSGKPRAIPFNAALQAELTALKRRNGRSPYVFPNPKTGEPVTTIKTAFHTACRRAGISGLRFHDLRHTFASRLVENGADIEIVRFLLGHSSLEMTQRYVHSTDERRRLAVEKLTQNLHLVVENGANLLHGCDTAGKSAPGELRAKSATSGFSVN